ncbi:MAG TPA: peptidoglycan-binding protein [Crinalium sp.]
MENLAFIYCHVGYEDPAPEPQLRSPQELGLATSSAAIAGLTGSAIALSILAPAPNAYAEVRAGDSCPAVTAVQTALQNRGYSVGEIDGVYGNNTVYAVTQFQRDNAIAPASGVVGATTAQFLGLSGASYTNGVRCEGSNTTASGGTTGTGGTSSTRSLTIATNGNYLNARTGPGANYPVGATYSDGTVLNTTGELQNGWYKLSNGFWVSSDWVTLSGSPVSTTGNTGSTAGSATTSSTSNRAGSITVNTNGNYLNARTGPGANYAVGASYSDGTVLNITGVVQNGWYKLDNGLWVSGEWVATR